MFCKAVVWFVPSIRTLQLIENQEGKGWTSGKITAIVAKLSSNHQYNIKENTVYVPQFNTHTHTHVRTVFKLTFQTQN